MPSSSVAVSVGPASQYCTFALGDLSIGIDVARVQEVLLHDPPTAVPLAPAQVRGLFNLRGKIVTVIDIRGQLGVPAQRELRMHVVIRHGDEAFAVLVDDAADVVTPDTAVVDPVPVTAPERVKQLVSGVVRLEDRLVLVLDTDGVVGLSQPAAQTQRSGSS